MKTGYHHYVINEQTGARLCKDGMWRNHANFGTYPSCVKVWNRQGWALRCMERLNQNRTVCATELDRAVAFVLSLPRGSYMDASGRIFDHADRDKGFCLGARPRRI